MKSGSLHLLHCKFWNSELSVCPGCRHSILARSDLWHTITFKIQTFILRAFWCLLSKKTLPRIYLVKAIHTCDLGFSSSPNSHSWNPQRLEWSHFTTYLLWSIFDSWLTNISTQSFRINGFIPVSKSDKLLAGLLAKLSEERYAHLTLINFNTKAAD